MPKKFRVRWDEITVKRKVAIVLADNNDDSIDLVKGGEFDRRETVIKNIHTKNWSSEDF